MTTYEHLTDNELLNLEARVSTNPTIYTKQEMVALMSELATRFGRLMTAPNTITR